VVVTVTATVIARVIDMPSSITQFG
jgi:hypothetical protein